MVIGEGEKHASALISPNFEELRNWCSEKNIDASSPQAIVTNEEVLTHYRNIVKELNSSLSKDEQVNRFKLVKDEWTPVTGELSPTLKLKRSVLNNKYRDMIIEIFNRN